jgi:hypothetical protein
MTTKQDWIKSQLLPNESASIACSRLNMIQEFENPESQNQIPAPINMVAIRELVPDIEAYNVLSNPIWDRITDAIGQQDLQTVNNHIKALLAGKLISLETVSKLAPLLSATMPDPNYQPVIHQSLAQQAGFGIVYTDEIQEVIDND